MKDVDGPERLLQLVADGLERDFARVRAPAGARTARTGRGAIAAVLAVLAAFAAEIAGIAVLTAGGSSRTSAVVVGADAVGA